jgi:hypothetical protein
MQRVVSENSSRDKSENHPASGAGVIRIGNKRSRESNEERGFYSPVCHAVASVTATSMRFVRRQNQRRYSVRPFGCTFGADGATKAPLRWLSAPFHF